MGFAKYSSIENHYQGKFIDGFVSHDPALKDHRYFIEEKIHGSNFQVHITADDIRFGKRTNFIGEDEKFFNYRHAVSKIQDVINAVQDYIQKSSYESITMYGELCGKGVQKEVFYFEDQTILLFDIKMEEEFLAPHEVRTFITSLGFCEKEYCVPLLKVVDGLENALAFDVIFDSIVDGRENNLAEGVVIKPLTPTFRADGKRFIIKKKNPSFLENKAGKVKDARKLFSYSELQTAFAEYINENRVAGIMSKYGEIAEPSQMGAYIKHVFNDAMDDYQKDFEIDLEGDQLREVSKISGKLIVPLLRKYL